MSFPNTAARNRPSAFTLVELMIVIAIIGVLASLVTVGVMKALERGKLVSARIEISQLEAAVSAAKLDLGNVEELPSSIILYSRPDQMMADNTPIGISSRNFLTKAFGKTWFPQPNNMGVYSSIPSMFWMGPTATYPVTLQGMEALVYFLGGLYQNGSFQGFSANKTTPWDLTGTKRKGPYYEFDAARVTASAGKLGYKNAWDGPYLYFSKGDYVYYTTNPILIGGVGVSPYRNSATTTANSFYNAKTFQIISSGQDQTFGTGGFYQPPFVPGVPGYDDMSNFSSTLLGKKDE